MSNLFNMFFALMVAHAFADFPFQTDTMAKEKNRNRPIDMSKVPPGQKPIRCWFYFLLAHALIHAGMVWLVSGYAVLAYAEFIFHFVIDFLKCDNKFNPHIDQLLHVICKLVYVAVFWFFLK